MRRNQIRSLGMLGLMFACIVPWLDVAAACTAANPSASVIESTPSADFVNPGDGTVTHTKTGLMWKQCAQGLSGAGCATGTAATPNWSAALAMAVTDTTGGHTDWRLPNKKELESLVETCGYGPAINQTLFPGTPTPKNFWSSSSYLGNTADAWTVAFNYGYNNAHDKVAQSNYVRLVRAVSPPDNFDAQAPRYTVTPSAGANGTISPATPQTVTGGATASFTVTPNAGYTASVGGTCGGTLIGTSYTTNPVTADCTVMATFAATAVNGACGAAAGAQSLFAPSANLCSAGTASTVNSAAGQYTWMCNGANGGSNATCSASWASTPSGGRVSASAVGAECTSRSGNAAAATNVPSNLSFPEGAINFTLSGCLSGGTANITVQYTNTLPAGAQYYKESGTNWSVYPGAVISGNTVTFSITDNGAQDSNPATGIITDPSGPAIAVATPPPPSAAVAAPVLSPAALILLCSLFGIVGVAVPRRRR